MFAMYCFSGHSIEQLFSSTPLLEFVAKYDVLIKIITAVRAFATKVIIFCKSRPSIALARRIATMQIGYWSTYTPFA